MNKPLTLAQLSGDVPIEGADTGTEGTNPPTEIKEGAGDTPPELDPKTGGEPEGEEKKPADEPNADAEKEARVAELQNIPDEDLTPENIKELRELGVDVLEDDGEFWGDVETLTGSKVEVDFGDIDPESPAGVLKYMEAYTDQQIESFEESLKKRAPRAYQAMLVEVDGGNPAEYFLPKGDVDTTDYSKVEITEDNIDVHKDVLRKAFSLRGMDAEVAEVTIAALEDTGKLRDTAEKDLKYVVDTTEGKRTEELQRVTQAKEQEAQLLSDMSRFVDTTLEKGNVGSFTIPKADQTKFNEFVKNSIQIKDGQFYTVSDVNQDNFNDVLQTLFFAYKGGNIDNLAKVQAKKDNVRRLKQRASSSRIAGQQNGSGSKITKLGDL